MKILFIDGYFTQNGWLCYRKCGKIVCGTYHNRITERFKIVNNHEVTIKRNSNKLITVVKQKSKWLTFRILCHELMHYLFDTLLPDKLKDKCDDWLDR